ncbi:MAG: hypothetical protein HY763_17275 [Planctomycetes bacterium]|nr:hypothetical protein [Planctomycetota bacterium]
MLAWLACLAMMQPAPAGECRCPQARRAHGWCDACRVGYVAGHRIPSQLMYEVLDAHGHEIDAQRLTCETCRKAIAEDGYCSTCRMGFIGGQAYLSRLTYYVARGSVVEPAELSCSACRAHYSSTGWCAACGVGIVGNVRYRNLTDFEAAAGEYRRLVAAVARLAECEKCAVASLTDGLCTKCGKAFRNGRSQPIRAR